MSQFTETHLPCPCGESSDAYSVYDSGVGHCFSCGTSFPPDSEGGVMAAASDLISDVEYVPLTSRGLTQETCKTYGYGVADFHGDKLQVAPYYDRAGRVVAQKIRHKDKTFTWVGRPKDATLFGQKMARTGGKMIVITEGEIDAMSVCQAMGGTWPALSVPNGAGGAKAAIRQQIDVLNAYERVVICFDNDEPGQEATEAVVELFSPGRVRIADLGGYKDANEMLQDGNSEGLRSAIWGAQEWRPDGVVNLSDLRERISAPLEMGVPYPWKGLNDLLYGFRPQELITWTAGTGTGKTAVVSELVHHVAVTKQRKCGIVFLEEGVDRAGKRLVGIHMNTPVHLPSAEYTDEEFNKAFDETLGSGNIYAYDHFGSLDEDTLVNRIRYMVVSCGCEVIVLDHVSMVVSGADLAKDERRMLDRVMTLLRSLTQETGATFHVVSHLKKPGGMGSHEEGMQVSLTHLRGTQAIAQLSDAVIAAERDQQAEDEEERNTTTLRVLKNRYAGLTGAACQLYYDHKTGRLIDIDDPVEGMTDDY